jgi:hypothetical protein
MTIPNAALYANPFLLWTNIALKSGEMMWASAQVISHRTSRILQAHPNYSVKDRREIALMGQEKIEAGYESAIAMSGGLVKMTFELGMLAFRQWFAAATALTSMTMSRTAGQYSGHQVKLLREHATRSAVAATKLSSSVAQIAHHGLKPIHSRATKNARRLGKR